LLQRARRANQIAEQLPDQIFRCLVRQVSGIAPHAIGNAKNTDRFIDDRFSLTQWRFPLSSAVQLTHLEPPRLDGKSWKDYSG
jgi:hypothetical protein